MNTIFRVALMAMLTVLTTQSFAIEHNERPINFEELPLNAQLFIKEYFPHLTVTRTSYNILQPENNYQTLLSDNSQIMFNEKGDWTEISCEETSIPTHLIPLKIEEHINIAYPSNTVIKISRYNKTIEVTLSSQLNLTFDSNYNLIDSIPRTIEIIKE